MPITKTAGKQLKITQRNRLRNRHHLTRMRSAVKAFLASLEEGGEEAVARAKLAYAQKLIHKNVSKGALRKATAVRKVSRLYKHFHRAFGRQPEPSA